MTVTAYELHYGSPDEKGRLRIKDKGGRVMLPPVNVRKLQWGVDECIQLQFNARYQHQNQDICRSCQHYPAPHCLEILGQIGKGSFGSVFLVLNTKNDQLIAMKTMEKKKSISQSENPENVARERKILGSIQFPFIVQGLGHFQTKTHLYILMEYVEGCELWSLVRGSKTGLHEDHVLHYLSEICITLEYLHSLGIVYRDLKLENVLIDKTGHIKLVDFGFSKKMVSSNTMCGTPEYLAPEIFQGKEYTKAVDWWAFGILAYELKTSKALFNASGTTETLRQKEVKEMVLALSTKVHISSLDTGYIFKDMLEKILVVDPQKRLGIQGKVRHHAFFIGVDFNKVYKRKYKGPIIKYEELDCKRGEVNPDIKHEINHEPFDIEEPFKGF